MARSFLKGGHGLSQTCNHVNWNKVTNPRRFGGLGLREARLGNVAMIVDLHPSLLLAHLSSPLKGTLKLNVDGSFLEGSGCLGGSGVVCNHDE
uniref:Uncharacterized protein n=1 Tax=Medicago truncatula TaxID=3880 RepID=A2Q4U7_MEDTR|nr:hypothetical protein MtrDRAFT_AC157891g20v2 [Medicago truncatula]